MLCMHTNYVRTHPTQVVINLVSNAVKFTGQHSSVELSAVVMTRAEAVHAAKTALCSDILHQERERERAGKCSTT
jgi:nitrogen-specific signal transduction histidine kinase